MGEGQQNIIICNACLQIILLVYMSQSGSSRVRSFSRGSERAMPGFQKRYKIRGGHSSVLDVDSLTPGRQRTKSLLFANSKRAPDESFYPTSTKLQGENFKHHDPNNCVCEDCLCGRHLCHLHVVKPDMSKTSTYQQDFFKKKPIQNKIRIAQNYDRLQGPNLSLNSTYQDYDGKNGDALERPCPEDLLKTGGPCNKLSSYSSGFPGYKGVNQYVKPTDKHSRGYFPLRSNSTYKKSFLGEPTKRSPHERIPDNLKTGSNWYGDTTYGTKFLHPNPEDYARKYKQTEKLAEKPNDKHQYETIYRNSFLNNKTTVCPAKILLQAKAKGAFSGSKGNFSENTDYKALSPDYHAISTSKHCYV